MSELIQPSIDLAKNGYALTALAADILNINQDDFNNKIVGQSPISPINLAKG